MSTTPVPLDSVASLLEQILAVSQASLVVQQEILLALQTANGTLNALLASSLRIEKLLGGEGPVAAPATVNVDYEFKF